MKSKCTKKTCREKRLDDLSIGVLAVDADGRLQFASGAAMEFLGIAKDAEDSWDQYSDDIYAISHLLKDNTHQFVYQNGQTFLCHSLSIQITGFTGYLVIVLDVTEMENIQAKLNEAQKLKEELDTVIRASYDYIFVTDAGGNVIKINDSYTRITGLRSDEVLGKNIYDLVKQGYFNQAVTIDVIEKKKTVTINQTINRTGKTVLVTGNPVFDENGNLVLVVTNGRDITELNNLRQQVEHAKNLHLHYQRELQKMQMEVTGDLVIASPKMLEISDLVKRIAKVDSTVLIYGESGVGKEIIAREIHKNSLRADKPYITINCAAIPDNLLESELFGYESGAFTGAKREGKMGIFQVANGGTLFLDEIGEIPFYLQAKLLRVLQENEVMRIGGTKPIPINVRLIAATNRDLWQMVQEGQFREDFYYRLNVIQIRIPPVRDRKEEIPVFVDYFVDMLNKKYNLNKILDPNLMKCLMDYDWPGNVREIRNVIEQAFVTSTGEIISEIKLGHQQEKYTSTDGQAASSLSIPLKDALQQYESRIIREALRAHGSTRKAAKALGVSQVTVWRKAIQYGIELDNREEE